MTTTIENMSRPGLAPQAGDWIKETTTRDDGSVFSVIEREFH